MSPRRGTCQRWQEISDDLVRRGPFLIASGNDLVYTPLPRAAAVFETGSANIIAGSELSFYVDDAGDCVFLEQRPGTWSQHVAKQTMRAKRSRVA